MWTVYISSHVVQWYWYYARQCNVWHCVDSVRGLSKKFVHYVYKSFKANVRVFDGKSGHGLHSLPQALRHHLSAWQTSHSSSMWQSQFGLGTQTANQTKFIPPILSPGQPRPLVFVRISQGPQPDFKVASVSILLLHNSPRCPFQRPPWWSRPIIDQFILTNERTAYSDQSQDDTSTPQTK